LNPTIRITRSGQKAISHLTLRNFTPATRDAEGALNQELLGRLRGERERIASRDGLLPENICPDTMLVRVSNALPTTRRSFMELDGATDQLYDACGTSFITLIGSLLADSQEEEGTGLPERLRRTYSLLGEGSSIEEIARRSALQPATISGHIEELIAAGVDIEIENLIASGILKGVREQLARTPRASLRELRALLGGAIGYPELRIAVAWIRAGK
jgi:ATP-dependent DNA helicase RecQ